MDVAPKSDSERRQQLAATSSIMASASACVMPGQKRRSATCVAPSAWAYPEGSWS